MRRSRNVTVDLSARRSGRGLDRASLSDAVLVARVRQGDAASFDVLVARHLPSVEGVARRRFRDPEDARDATQEALARLVQNLPAFRGESAFSTWLHRLTVNACIDHGRRLERRRRAETPDAGTAGRGLADEDVADGVSGELPAQLAGLSAAQRRVVVLKDVLSLRYEDVARVMELPVGTVKCHAHRGRKRLAEHLRRPA
jgi:RNA polymerase sigma-70 factor (ECF subfamily)